MAQTLRAIRGVGDDAWQRLKETAANEERSMGDVLEDMINQYRGKTRVRKATKAVAKRTP